MLRDDENVAKAQKFLDDSLNLDDIIVAKSSYECKFCNSHLLPVQ